MEDETMQDTPPNDSVADITNDEAPAEANRDTQFEKLEEPDTFLDSDCGKTGLTLVAHSAAVIAEIFRLSNHIPDVFLFNRTGGTKGQKEKFTYISAEGKTLSPEEVRMRYFEHEKYLQILYSYDYLNNRDEYDEKLKTDMTLFDLD